jgi:hypothetical protein
MATEEMRTTVYSEDFKNRARKRREDFTRERKMPFTDMICFMMNQVKQSTQTALDHFFDLLDKKEVHMSQQSFSEARQKLKWEACRELMDLTVSSVYRDGYSTWKGYRIWAIDGSKMQLPSDPKLLEAFGTAGRGERAATAQSSCLYDVLNDYIADALLVPMHTDERSLAFRHLAHLQGMESFGKELVILDRGYPSAALIKAFQQAHVRFLMRVRTKFSRDIDRMPLGDRRCVLTGNGGALSVRVIKFLLPSGEIETLITDLFGKSIGISEFKALYFKRWPVETKFGELKIKLEIENFSGRTENAILQDYYITACLSNLISIAANEAQPIIDGLQSERDNKYDYKVNRNHAAGVFKDRFIQMLIEPNTRKSKRMYDRIIRLLISHATPIRPDRSVPRNPCPRSARFHFNQKSNC